MSLACICRVKLLREALSLRRTNRRSCAWVWGTSPLLLGRAAFEVDAEGVGHWQWIKVQGEL